MPERALVTGFTWIDGAVRLKAFRGDPPRLDDRLLDGRVCFRILPGRHCTGRYEGVAVPCPDAAPATRGTTCDACAALDAFRPCMTCDGFRCPRLSPDMLSYCRQRHHLYLACFGDTTIKVGTASHPRRDQRVVEQGPLAAARIAVAPGPTIKQMEHLLVEAGLTETMRRTRKTVLITGSMTEPEARALVLEAAGDAREMLPPRYHRHLHRPELVAQPPLATQSRGLPVNELKVDDDRVVEGQVVGAVGHVLFVEDGDGCFALDLGALKGRWIEWDPTGPRRRPVAQLGLF
ncbi:MAG: DUF2797 domain-containing protein [Myxococcota bacterium]